MKELDMLAQSSDIDLHDLVMPIAKRISSMTDISQKVAALNHVRQILHSVSPFANEPVDCVLWIASEHVEANDYNPNSVAPPEMKLLELSIRQDGYTQPIVGWKRDSVYEVVDGFHRNRVGKESNYVNKRIHGYLPIAAIKEDRQDKSDRMSATIRHNRARGKHKVDAMSDIVVELRRRNWSNERIASELGMDQDEVLRLCQITGLSELFSDGDFSKAWEAEGDITESDFTELQDEESIDKNGNPVYRTVNTSDPDRIFHTFDKWECFKAGFYSSSKEGMTKTECEEAYASFLRDIPRFERALDGVTREWKHSCEHYLTNKAMNRIAWLGQASVCYDSGIPCEFRSGFFRLSDAEQKRANECALRYLNKWLASRGMNSITMQDATTDRQSVIY